MKKKEDNEEKNLIDNKKVENNTVIRPQKTTGRVKMTAGWQNKKIVNDNNKADFEKLNTADEVLEKLISDYNLSLDDSQKRNLRTELIKNNPSVFNLDGKVHDKADFSKLDFPAKKYQGTSGADETQETLVVNPTYQECKDSNGKVMKGYYTKGGKNYRFHNGKYYELPAKTEILSDRTYTVYNEDGTSGSNYLISGELNPDSLQNIDNDQLPNGFKSYYGQKNYLLKNGTKYRLWNGKAYPLNKDAVINDGGTYNQKDRFGITRNYLPSGEINPNATSNTNKGAMYLKYNHYKKLGNSKPLKFEADYWSDGKFDTREYVKGSNYIYRCISGSADTDMYIVINGIRYTLGNGIDFCTAHGTNTVYNKNLIDNTTGEFLPDGNWSGGFLLTPEDGQTNALKGAKVCSENGKVWLKTANGEKFDMNKVMFGKIPPEEFQQKATQAVFRQG